MCLLAVHLLQCRSSLCLHPGNRLLLLCFYIVSLWLRRFLLVGRRRVEFAPFFLCEWSQSLHIYRPSSSRHGNSNESFDSLSLIRPDQLSLLVSSLNSTLCSPTAGQCKFCCSVNIGVPLCNSPEKNVIYELVNISSQCRAYR